MKRLGIVAFIVVGLAHLLPAAQPDVDLVVNGRGLLPLKAGDWSGAGGVDVQLRFWKEPGFAVALSAGVEEWKAKREFYEERDAEGYFSMTVEGELLATPMGVSVLRRWPAGPFTFVILEAGLRYVFCRSDIRVETHLLDAHGDDWYRDAIIVDDTVVGRIGLSVEGEIAEEISFRGEIGFQKDLLRPSQTHLGHDIGATSLDAIGLGFGLVIRF